MHALGGSTICQNEVLPTSVTLLCRQRLVREVRGWAVSSTEYRVGVKMEESTMKCMGDKQRKVRVGRLGRLETLTNGPKEVKSVGTDRIAVKSHWLIFSSEQCFRHLRTAVSANHDNATTLIYIDCLSGLFCMRNAMPTFPFRNVQAGYLQSHKLL
jgi:hypothetical protein